MTQAPTELDEAVAQAFERAASEAQAELQLQEKQADLEAADTNDSGNNTVNEESTAEVSGQSSEHGMLFAFRFGWSCDLR